eukprot:scaffold81098_cov46-Phaeocystis_antarctica.AAC.3
MQCDPMWGCGGAGLVVAWRASSLSSCQRRCSSSAASPSRGALPGGGEGGEMSTRGSGGAPSGPVSGLLLGVPSCPEPPGAP